MSSDVELYRLLRLPVHEMTGFPVELIELLDDLDTQVDGSRGQEWTFGEFEAAAQRAVPAVYGTPRQLLDQLVDGGFVGSRKAPPRAISPDYIPPSRPW